jgi:hypothetical protein
LSGPAHKIVSPLHLAKDAPHIAAAGAGGETALTRSEPVAKKEGDLRMIRLALTCILSAALPFAAAAKPIPGPEAQAPKPAVLAGPALALPAAAKKDPAAAVPLLLTGEAELLQGKVAPKPLGTAAKHRARTGARP